MRSTPSRFEQLDAQRLWIGIGTKRYRCTPWSVLHVFTRTLWASTRLSTARLLMNRELFNAGYPAVVLPVEQRLRVCKAHDAAYTRSAYAPFLALMAAWLAQRVAVYGQVLGVSDAERWRQHCAQPPRSAAAPNGRSTTRYLAVFARHALAPRALFPQRMSV